jgi:hypothetical protein
MIFADATPIDGRGHRTRQTELLISGAISSSSMAADRFALGCQIVQRWRCSTPSSPATEKLHGVEISPPQRARRSRGKLSR